MSPQEMRLAVDKVAAAGNTDVLLTERGTFFGYNRLVNDFTGLAVMREIRQAGGVRRDSQHAAAGRAGRQQRREPAVRPAAGPGGRGRGRGRPLFIECHPDPKNAKSDAATVLDLSAVEPLLRSCRQIADLRGGLVTERCPRLPGDECFPRARSWTGRMRTAG